MRNNNLADNNYVTIKDTDRLEMLHVLLSYPLINYLHQFFNSTRSWDVELNFVQYCRKIISKNIGKLTEKEIEDFDKSLIYCEFNALDRLNFWDEYIFLFNHYLKEKQYSVCYCRFRSDPVFDSYILYQDDTNKYVHFLYLTHRRYETICRKQKRLLDGKSTEYLKRHQKLQLNDNDLKERYEYMSQFKEYTEILKFLKIFIEDTEI